MQLLPALLFPEKDKQAALAVQEQDTSPGSGFMLLCFAFVHLAGRLDFAYFGSFSCSSEELFLSEETALWQHLLKPALMID